MTIVHCQSWLTGRNLRVSEKIIHGNLECYRDPPQSAGTGQARLATLDLIKGRPRDLGASRELIGAPTLGIAKISYALSQGNHLSHPRR